MRSTRESDHAGVNPLDKEIHRCRHGGACPGHPRLSCLTEAKTWMPGTRPGMTSVDEILEPHGEERVSYQVANVARHSRNPALQHLDLRWPLPTENPSRHAV